MKSAHAIITTNIEGIITGWNGGAEQLLGYHSAEIVGKPLLHLIPSDRLHEHRETVSCLLRGEEVNQPETVRLRKDGSMVPLCLTQSPIYDGEGNFHGARTIAHDLTEHKGLRHQIQRAQKMESFGRLTEGIAHDFNNVLTVILGYSEFLNSYFKPEVVERELLGEIHRAAERAETLTRQLLTFSRKQIPEPRVIDLPTVISDTEKMLRRLIGEDIFLTTHCTEHLPSVKIDPSQLQQVILNLAVNARAAMPQGGKITIEGAVESLPNEYAGLHPGARPGAYVVLTVTDTGIGMSPETVQSLFEPRSANGDAHKEPCLGLATVQAITSQNGGHVTAKSEPGNGTTIRVYLPPVEQRPSIYKMHTEMRGMPGGNETILLVEDEDTIRKLTRHVLERCGYTVLEASNGEEALWLTGNHDKTIHLLVTDVIMPRLGGGKLAEQLTALYPRMKVLFLSGYPHETVIRNGIQVLECAFLQKPFAPGDLTRKVRETLDGAFVSK